MLTFKYAQEGEGAYAAHAAQLESLKRTGNLKLNSNCSHVISPLHQFWGQLDDDLQTSPPKQHLSPGVSPATAGPVVTASYLRQHIASTSTLEKSSRVSGACIFICTASLVAFRSTGVSASPLHHYSWLIVTLRLHPTAKKKKKTKHMMEKRSIRSASVGSLEDDSGCHKIGG
jgi:hypothetical protein